MISDIVLAILCRAWAFSAVQQYSPSRFHAIMRAKNILIIHCSAAIAHWHATASRPGLCSSGHAQRLLECQLRAGTNSRIGAAIASELIFVKIYLSFSAVRDVSSKHHQARQTQPVQRLRILTRCAIARPRSLQTWQPFVQRTVQTWLYWLAHPCYIRSPQCDCLICCARHDVTLRIAGKPCAGCSRESTATTIFVCARLLLVGCKCPIVLQPRSLKRAVIALVITESSTRARSCRTPADFLAFKRTSYDGKAREDKEAK
jgi:hypothetical protein